MLGGRPGEPADPPERSDEVGQERVTGGEAEDEPPAGAADGGGDGDEAEAQPLGVARALALEWGDVDRKTAVASVERVHSQGRTKPCKKSDRQRRRVPLRARVLDALDEVPRRLDSPLVFPARDGGHIKLATFRLRHWTPALRAAGIDHRRVYDCRHTFAAWSLAAGVQLFYLSRIMGTSVAQIDATYGHLVPDSEEYLRGLLDTYDAKEAAGG